MGYSPWCPKNRHDLATKQQYNYTCCDMNQSTGEQEALPTQANRILGLPFPGSGSPERSNWLLTKPAHPAGPDA